MLAPIKPHRPPHHHHPSMVHSRPHCPGCMCQPRTTTPTREADTHHHTRAWQLWLNDHPDQEFAFYLLDGIASGFRIGFAHGSHLCTPAKTNHPSAVDHPTVISEGLQAEVNKGRLIGPLNPGDFPYAQISSLGAVEKKHSTKWSLTSPIQPDLVSTMALQSPCAHLPTAVWSTRSFKWVKVVT